MTHIYYHKTSEESYSRFVKWTFLTKVKHFNVARGNKNTLSSHFQSKLKDADFFLNLDTLTFHCFSENLDFICKNTRLQVSMYYLSIGGIPNGFHFACPIDSCDKYILCYIDGVNDI